MTTTEVEPRTTHPVPDGSGLWRVLTVWRGPPSNRNAFAGELTDARNRKCHFDLYAPATAACDLNGRSAQVAGIQELSQDLAFYRFNYDSGNYEQMFRGIIGHSEDTLDASTHTVNVQAADYRAMLNRCLVQAQSFTTQYQEVIVGAILSPYNYYASYPGNQGIGNYVMLNPDSSYMSGSTPTRRTITYNGTETVGAEVDKLATMQGGFDWGCEANWAWTSMSPADLTANFYIWYPYRGVTKTFVAEYGVNVAAVKRVVDSTSFANYVQMTGASGTAAQVAQGDAWTSPQNHAEGGWQITKSDSNVSDTSLLLAEAQYELGIDSALTPAYQLTLMPNAWRNKTDCWLGDTITVNIKSGRLQVNTTARVVQVDITVNDDGTETVQLTVSKPILNLANVLADQQQNLYQLNRR